MNYAPLTGAMLVVTVKGRAEALPYIMRPLQGRKNRANAALFRNVFEHPTSGDIIARNQNSLSLCF